MKSPRPQAPASVVRTGGGRFDPQEENVYFIASNMDRQQYGAAIHDHLLVAVNELQRASQLFATFESWLDQGKSVFLDSGVFNLAMTHARAHGISHDQALNLPPSEVDGFTALFDAYVDIVRQYGDRLWGYVEIDQGGRENKLLIRAKLEALGLHPIPVYHPFGDGWDYFDLLAQCYDRVCHGNIVKATSYSRKRLVATAWERHRRYPYLWIHLLGLTPNEWIDALPVNSGDSSTWLAPIRWPVHPVRSAGRAFGMLPTDFRYVLGSDMTTEVGSQKAVKLCAYQQLLEMRSWRRFIAEWERQGCEPYPAPTGEMRRANGTTAP